MPVGRQVRARVRNATLGKVVKKRALDIWYVSTAKEIERRQSPTSYSYDQLTIDDKASCLYSRGQNFGNVAQNRAIPHGLLGLPGTNDDTHDITTNRLFTDSGSTPFVQRQKRVKDLGV